MQTDNPTAVRKLLDEFSSAWARRDVPALLELLTDDCIYSASVGSEPGQTFVGRHEIEVGVKLLFSHDGAVRAETTDYFEAGDRAAWEWKYYDGDGDLIAHGSDLFLVRDGKIARKNAFRKVHV